MDITLRGRWLAQKHRRWNFPTTARDADNKSESDAVVVQNSGLRLVGLWGIAILVSAFIVDSDTP